MSLSPPPHTYTRFPSVEQEHPAVSLGERALGPARATITGEQQQDEGSRGAKSSPRQPLPLSPPRLPSAGSPFHPSESEPEGVMRLPGKSQEFQKINKHLVALLWFFFFFQAFGVDLSQRLSFSPKSQHNTHTSPGLLDLTRKLRLSHPLHSQRRAFPNP